VCAGFRPAADRLPTVCPPSAGAQYPLLKRPKRAARKEWAIPQMDISAARQAIVREFNGAGRPPKRASRFEAAPSSPQIAP